MAQAWDHVFGYIKSNALKCAVELEIPDILEKHGSPISLSHLSDAVKCPPDTIYRLMRLLTHHGIFDKTGHIYYSQTPLSRQFTKSYLGPMLLLQGGPSSDLTVELLRTGKSALWCDDYYNSNMIFSTRIFIEAMASHSRMMMSALVRDYPEGFEGIGVMVDVGGNDGSTLALLVKAFPWIRGVCFDLPNVVARAPPLDGIEFVGGSMFECVPKADVVTLVWVLHNWSDLECVEILKKCKEAVPVDAGKVMIIDVVVDEDGESRDELTAGRLGLDLTMMAKFPNGKERTYKEWTCILKEAGFSNYVAKHIKALESVIEAYP